jgi:16S rRNA (guanine(966)-N(2))-methyltransferase RsmD
MTAGHGEVRVIGGRWKRSKLPVPDSPGLRPTPDRVRETLFNWLGQDLTGWRCLDAFAGSGALGFEAGSRGAARVVLLERDRKAAASLQRSVDRLQATALQVVCTEALGWMAAAEAASFELVLLDPPFDSGLASGAMAAATRLLSPGGLIYLEAAQPVAIELLQAHGLMVHRRGRAGAVHFQLLCRPPTPVAPAG